jgi:putative protease
MFESPRRPEILAPAGDDASLGAALAAGADAVYFGLDDGFNARARATNFSLASLPDVVRRVHRAGARAYVTLNTLVFEPELPTVEAILRGVAEAGVDAIIVQDPAVALLARAICPALEIHASTQMTITSGEAAQIAAQLGCNRVVVPRELSVEEIRQFAATSPIELEVFIHGALCVSWSGQCLTSESWGGRSANRGQCAQSCRLPYDLVVDGETRDLGDVRYLLSPQDLAGAPVVPELAAAGVASLKIEGRQKGPAYVASAVAGYKRWRDSILDGNPDHATLAADLATMGLAYTRGQSLGFLGGTDHQSLVVGRAPKHRGLYVGTVTHVAADHVEVRRTDDVPVSPAAGPVIPRPGLGVVFDEGHPEADEIGGPIFTVDAVPAPPRGARDAARSDGWVIGFGRPGPDLSRVKVGARLWLTSDPSFHASAAKLGDTEPTGRIPLSVSVAGAAGSPLTVRAIVADAASTTETRAEHISSALLVASRGTGLDEALLREKLGSFGGTRYHLASLDLTALAPSLHLPVSELKSLRRALVESLDASLDAPPSRTIAVGSQIANARVAATASASASATASDSDSDSDSDSVSRPPSPVSRPPSPVSRPPSPVSPLPSPSLIPLCRTDAQLDALLLAGAPEIELDWMELVGLSRAVTRARAANACVVLATPRILKPDESKILSHLVRLEPDAILVRSWAALVALARLSPATPLHADFSLNLTNSITASFILSQPNLVTATVAHDLDHAQLVALLTAAAASTSPARLAVTVHHHIPTFHTEHCVYAHLLSSGKDFRTCGRPCEAHEVSLRDRTALVHPVVVDIGCRNTVFNAQAQSAASLVPELLSLGVRRLRLELVRETAAETTRLYAAYRALAAGESTPAEVVRAARVHEQFGVTRGTMRTLPVLPG